MRKDGLENLILIERSEKELVINLTKTKTVVKGEKFLRVTKRER